ncbi:MAG: glycosyltransferase family 2 protein [Myxococcales bacterium]|nr:glycosyltransferase family 2 protein [Myxococcales bacterium]
MEDLIATLPPALAVVIAAHNEEHAIGRCLESVLASRSDLQNRLPAGLPCEVIVVDNRSTDRTATVAASFPGVRVVECALLGAVHAKTAGVAIAVAPLVAVIDADSTCPADWLAKIVAAFAAEPDLVGLSGPARYRKPRLWVRGVMVLWYGWWKTIAWCAGKAFYATGTNVAFRRAAYLAAGGFDTNVLVGGDEVGFFHRLRKRGMTRFTDDLWVETDPRRTEVGFLRFFFSTVMLRYVINYTIYRITGRSLVKGYLPGSKV